MIPPTSPPSDLQDRDPSFERPRSDPRRVLWISLSISAVLHVAGIVLYAVIMARSSPVAPPSDPTASQPAPQGTEVVRMVVVSDEPAPPDDEEDVETLPEVERSEPVPERPTAADPRADAPEAPEGRTPTAAELLRPRTEGDERIWRPTDPALLELSPSEIAELRVAGRLQDWADSVAAVREAERRALDWTHTDDEGRRWGVSPEGLHLGDVTLPLPSLESKHAESSRRQYEWGEIERGAADAATRYRQQDRAKAIRERMNREREEARADTTAGSGGG